MIISASAMKELAQDLMERYVRTRAKNAVVASGGCYWVVKDLKEGRRLQKSFLTTTLVVRTIEQNLPVMVTSRPIWVMSVYYTSLARRGEKVRCGKSF